MKDILVGTPFVIGVIILLAYFPMVAFGLGVLVMLIVLAGFVGNVVRSL